MRDIRIISGKKIAPALNTVLALLGYKNMSDKQTDIKALFDDLLPEVKMCIRPKAALAIEKGYLYVMLTLGGGISRLIDKRTEKNDLLSAVVLDAMADSSLFVFEEQLLPILRQICLTEGYGIAKRFEIPMDFPIEMQKKAYEILNAERTLGLTMTSEYMLNPVKSMCMVFELTEDVRCRNMRHDCSKCDSKDCLLRKEPEIYLRIGKKTITCAKGSNLLEVLQNNGISQPVYCAGKGKCGKCGVFVEEGSLPVTAEDKVVFSEMELQKGKRLSCQAVLQENLTISLKNPSEEDFFTLGSEGTEDVKINTHHSYQRGEYGIAIDIGTTTLAFALMELQSGRIIDNYTALNSQRIYGADVISRIQASNEGKKEQLYQCINKDIRKGINTLVEKNLSGNSKFISHIVIAANTVMMHLLRGYDCEGFAYNPFAPKTLDIEEITLAELFAGLTEQKQQLYLPENTKVTLLPGISAFVGADITAGLYACVIKKYNETCLFLDLGTNGEMALKVKDKIYVTSVAAGPAFEGGNIQWGTGSIPGAIAKVAINEGEVQIETIGEQPPEGICGTGVLEITAELLRMGIMDKTGKLIEPYFSTGYPLAENLQGEIIALTQQDIREIQLAKAAIRAGIEILLMHADISYEAVEQVYLAGGFGFYLDVKKASAIGILPEELAEKAVAAGNTALKGALQFLVERNLKMLQQITVNAQEIPLVEDKKFQELYLKYMQFEKLEK